MGRVIAVSSFQFLNLLSGDPQLESGFTFSNEVTSGPSYALQFIGCDFATHSSAQPALLIALPPGGVGGVGNIYGLTFQGNNCTNIDPAGAIRGANYINSDGDAMAGNYLQSGAALCDVTFTPLSGIPGQPINHRLRPMGGLDIMLMDPTKPAMLIRNTVGQDSSAQVYSSASWPDQFDAAHGYTQVLSASSAEPSAFDYWALSKSQINAAHAPVDVLGPAIPGTTTEKSGTAFLTWTAHSATDPAKSAVFVIWQQWKMVSGTTTMLGSPHTSISEDLDGGFTAPVIGVDGANGFKVTLTSHAAQQSTQSVELHIKGNGR
jgi:hypothetical protein